MCSVNFQPSLPSFCAASRAASSTSSGMPAGLAPRSITIENALVASSTFSENFADSARELFLDLGVALLALRAAAPRRRGGNRAARSRRCFLPGGRQLRELRGILQRLVLLEQRLVLAELGPVLGDLRQVGVVDLAQLRVVHHRVQVRDLAPGAAEALVRVLERRDELVPGRRALDRPRCVVARPSASSCSIAGATCSGLMSAKRGRPEKSSSGLFKS